MEREQCIEALNAVEKRRLEVLSEMSDPFKGKQDQSEVVINLQMSHSKMYDKLFFDYSIEPLEFELNCEEHGLLKHKDEQKAGSLSRNAMAIANNLI